jgi:hypothetical protein
MYEMSCNVEGRPAVKLSDNYTKTLGPPSETERYRRVFGTAGITLPLSREPLRPKPASKGRTSQT